MRILISAYACAPDKGSEPEAGLRTLLTSARHHETWLITQSKHIDQLRAVLGSQDVHANLVALEGPRHDNWAADKHLTQIAHYLRWQDACAHVALSLDAQIDFHVVHHATFASYWSRPGVSAVPKPLVWGPVGGATVTPAELLSEIGLKGLPGDLARRYGRRIFASVQRARRTAAQAAVVIAQNAQTLAALGDPPNGVVYPNAAVAGMGISDNALKEPQSRSLEIAVVGNLIPLKGGSLAIKAFSHVSNPESTLHFYGDGPEEQPLRRLAQRFNMRERVMFNGRVSRPVLLAKVRGAGAVLHPALHDEAPFAVGEALALGTPVVTLDNSGPATVARFFPDSPSCTVRTQAASSAAAALGASLNDFLDNPPPIPTKRLDPTPSFEEVLRSAYEQAGRPHR